MKLSLRSPVWTWLTVPLAILSIISSITAVDEVNQQQTEIRQNLDCIDRLHEMLLAANDLNRVWPGSGDEWDAAYRTWSARIAIRGEGRIWADLSPGLDRASQFMSRLGELRAEGASPASDEVRQLSTNAAGEIATAMRLVWNRQAVVSQHLATHWKYVNVLVMISCLLAIFPALLSRIYNRELREREAAEQALRISEARYRGLFENVPDGVYQSTVDGRILAANPALVRILGFTSEEELKATSAGMLYVDPEERNRTTEKLHTEGRLRNEELRLQRRDGRRITVMENAHPVFGPDGGIVFYEGTLTDITERKEAERALEQQTQQLIAQSAELREARDTAVKASRLKSEFLANVSHEIRTPMNGVIGMTNLLLDTELNAEQTEYASLVHRSAEYLLDTINQILDFSKIEAGRLQLEWVEFGLRPLVENILELQAHRAEAKGIELICDIAPDVPDSLIGDPGRLRQVLTNLIANAVKFTDSGEVVVRTRAAEGSGQEWATLRFEVHDTGIGISAEGKERLFHPFSQADGSTTRRYGGTGLGLAICKQLVELMGGEIGVESEPDAGSMFWFTVLARRRLPAPAQTGDPALKGCRVLIAEPNATLRACLRQRMEHWEMLVDEAAGIDGCLRMPSLRQCDILLAELADAAQEDFALVREAQNGGGTPVVVIMTPFSQRAAGRRLKDAGVQDWISKPVSESQLFAVLSRAIATDQSNDTQLRLLSEHTSRPEPREARARVLVAEDNEVSGKLALRLLEKLGFAADLVKDGRRAVAAAAERDYSLILMDCQMPGMDGIDATLAIRKDEARSGNAGPSPIIAMTASDDPEQRRLCLEAGMNDYVSKPIKFEELAATIERWTGRLVV